MSRPNVEGEGGGSNDNRGCQTGGIDVWYYVPLLLGANELRSKFATLTTRNTSNMNRCSNNMNRCLLIIFNHSTLSANKK